MNRVVAALVVVFLVGIGIGAGVAAAIATNDHPAVKVGSTFTAKIYSYSDGAGGSPHTVCFSEDRCGQPLTAKEGIRLRVGMQARVTEIWLRNAHGNGHLAYLVEPIRQ